MSDESERPGRVSDEYLAIRVLEFLVSQNPENRFTVYSLMKIPNIRTQRQPRMRQLLENLVTLRFVEKWVPNPNVDQIYYRITQEGRQQYQHSLQTAFKMFKDLRKL